MSIKKPSLVQRIQSLISGWGGALIGLFGAALLFREWWLSGTRNASLWANDFDPKLIYWIVNWGYHILFEQRDWANFWNANSFYPNIATLAYSDSLLSLQLFFIPLRALGIPPLASMYLALGAVCVVGAALTKHALDRLGYFSTAEATFITFAAHFGLSMVSFFNHYQMFGFQLAPPFFLFLYIYLRDLNYKDLLIVCSLFSIGVCFATYLAPMLLILSSFMCVPLVAKQIKLLGIRTLIGRVGPGGIIIPVIFAVVLYWVQIAPYVQVLKSLPKPPFEEMVTYSANFDSIFHDFSIYSIWYGHKNYSIFGQWEYAFSPGVLLLSFGFGYLLLLAGSQVKRVIAAFGRPGRFHGTRTGTDRHEIEPALILFMVILLVSCIVLSWGPFIKTNHSVRLPFYYLARIVPGLDNVRAPGRFGIFVGFPLAIFSIAFIRFFSTDRSKRTWLLLGMFAFAVVEAFPTYPIFPFLIDKQGIYQWVSKAIQPGTPLLELPVLGTDNLGTIQLAMQQLDGSTIHWGKLVAGYGAKTSPQYNDLLQLDKQIQNGHSDLTEVFKFGMKYRISYYLIHIDRYDFNVAEEWRRVFRRFGKNVLFEYKGTVFLKLDTLP